MKVKSIWQKITASLLAATIAVAFVPNVLGNNIVNAVTTKNQDNTCLGTSQMASPATPTASSDWSGSYVYYGTYGDEPILFRVLAPSTTAYGGSTLFLDSDVTLFNDYFDNTSPYSNYWEFSDIRATLNGSFLNGFTDLEKAAIATSTGNGGCSYVADSFQEYFYGSPVSVNDKVFLLDAAEITNEAYGYSSDPGCALNSGTWSGGDYTWHTVSNHIKGGSTADWWLRSADADYSSFAGIVSTGGRLFSYYVYDGNGVAPALNINQSSIIFSSLISGSFNQAGAVYMLTIKDPDLDIAVPSGQQVAVSGTTVTVPYEIGGANAGNATRASILITDKAWDASGATIKLYDALGTNTDTSGTFTLPSDLDLSGWGTDYHVYILAEDINDGHDGKDTDYASAPVELASPIASTYTVTVNSGSADVTTAAQGATVTLTAGAAPAGKEFDKWVVDSGTITLADATSATTTFTMPAEDVEVTATYRDIAVTTYNITVNSGSADVTTAAAGATVSLTADAAPAGKEFDKWVVDSGTITLADATSATTTFTMPAEDVEVTATYRDVAVTTYNVTVNSGSADVTTAASGSIVTLTAGTAPAGKEFDKWVVDSGTITLADATSATTTFTMPAEDVEVTATYKDIAVTTYTVTFESNGGSVVAAQTVANGSQAVKPADPTKDGFTFDGWYQDATCTVAFSFDTAITADITLYAKWTENSVVPTNYTVTFESNGGTAVSSQIVADGSKAVKPADPTKDGFTFDGWYQDATCTVAFSFDTAITADITLYAKWTPIATVYYTVVGGANTTWTEGDVVITVKRSEDDEHCIDYFTGVKINDTELVNGTDYTAVAGSTVVTIKESTLASLAKGGHTITVTFKDGTAVTSITLKDAATATPTPTPAGGAIPKTGEDTSMTVGLGVLCLVISGAVFSVVLFERKKRKNVQ